MLTNSTQNSAMYADDTEVRLIYYVSFKRKQLGYYDPHTKEWHDNQNNDCDFENLEQCLQGLYNMYEYSKDYYFSRWFLDVKIKIDTY